MTKSSVYDTLCNKIFPDNLFKIEINNTTAIRLNID